ncbi:MAG: hypothetical protein IKN43_12360, partial [Selenomonadaceae bacterium]|nr:hypothetical protein [Selenomonadaceae bacterium]
DTIMKIYAAITDFREYMYSTNLLSKIWGEIARDILNSELRNYCIGMSRFNHKRLKPSDFSHIYEPQETGKIKKFIYKFVRNMFNKIYKLPGYDDMVSDLLTMQDGNIKNALNYGKDVLIYGSGTIAEALLPIVKKTYPEIRVIGCVVSEKESAQGTLDGIPIEWIDTFKRNPQQITVITATVIWEYQFEMNEKLKQLGFVSVINLL